MSYLYIFGTIFFTVYGQIILKWRMDLYPELPENLFQKAYYLTKIIFSDPYVFSGFFSAFLASICWLAVLTKYELSYAYPFMIMSFVLIFLSSVLMFNETISINKVIGLSFIVMGVFINAVR